MGCQTVSLCWCSLTFADDIVGMANSTTLGLAESGFGAAQLLLPTLFILISQTVEPLVAWRVALLVPGILQMVIFIYVLLATKDPLGGRHPSVHSSRRAGGRESRKTWKVAVKNYRTWVFMLLYGIVLGIGLSIYNIITSYYFDNFDIRSASIDDVLLP